MSCMTQAPLTVPEIAEHERTPLVRLLLEIIDRQNQIITEQAAKIRELQDEISKLKALPPRPKIKPSKLESPAATAPAPGARTPRSRRTPRLGSAAQHRTVDLKIPPGDIPPGSTFKGYNEYTIQEIHIQVEVITFRRERYDTPDGKTLVAPLPESLRVVGGHFGPNLIAYVLDQYYHHRVTQPRLLEQLRDLGIDISSAQLSLLLTTNKEAFHTEKQEILTVGLVVSSYLHVDDTGDRHKGRNGFMTVIGNDLFAYFRASDSKSRLNFLLTLRGEYGDYFLHELSFAYLQAQEISQEVRDKLAAASQRLFADEAAWLAHLDQLGITSEAIRKTLTEAAVLGSVLNRGSNPELGILSDGAPQFDLIVLLHALCWIHALRPLERLTALDEGYQKELDRVFEQVWSLYRELKAYQADPQAEQREKLSKQFDTVFGQQTAYTSLTEVLGRILQKKDELLVVLQRPEMPLHNNGAERDIREHAQRRKISGTTRSDAGKKCRDTFLSLAKTCRKLGVSFHAYLRDRLSGEGKIARLADLMRSKAAQKHEGTPEVAPATAQQQGAAATAGNGPDG